MLNETTANEPSIRRVETPLYGPLSRDQAEVLTSFRWTAETLGATFIRTRDEAPNCGLFLIGQAALDWGTTDLPCLAVADVGDGIWSAVVERDNGACSVLSFIMDEEIC